MSKIVIDARESGTTSGRYVDKMIEHMHRLGTPHDIVLLAKAKRLDYLHGIAPTFEVIETPYEEFSFGEQIGFKKQIEALNADLVHFPMPQQPAFYNGNVVTTIQDLTTIRFHNPAKNPVVFWVKQKVYKWLIKRVCHKSSELIAITEFVRRDAADFTGIPLEKFTVTLEAADELSDVSTPYTPAEGKDFIMYVGRPTPHKNLGRLIEAFEILQQTHPDLYLVLVGKKDFNYELHEKTVREKGLKNVIFTDFIPDDQLRWLYEHCRAYIFPSLSEGFGLPGLQAMLYGVAVVSSNATCLPEVHGDACEYFDPLDVQDMATKIAGVIDDEAKRNSLIEKGYVQAGKFSWSRMAQQTFEVYEKALSGR